MDMPKAINQAEIDEIIASYDKKIARFPEMEASLRVTCQADVMKAIARQRQEAKEAGGELAERIKAEDEAMLREAEALQAKLMNDPNYRAAMEDAKKRQAEIEAKLAEIKAESNTQGGAASGTAAFAPTGEWTCKFCGGKSTGKFCSNCGAPRG